jgi:TonB-dependent receptor-like protein
MFRVGARFSPSPNSDVITSLIYGNRPAKRQDRLPPPFSLPTKVLSKQDGWQGEGQYLFRSDRLNMVIGFTGYNINDFTRASVGGRTIIDESATIDQNTLYAYLHILFPDHVFWTMGFSYDDFGVHHFDNLNYQVRNYSPKLGVQWNITEAMRLRFAAFQAIKPALFANRTIQPTQIAGFNQFYDGINGTTSWNYGAGFDARLTENVYGGFELSWRDVDEPAPRPGREFFEDRKEQLYRAYLY